MSEIPGWKKYGSLILLIFQNSTHALLIRYSQTLGSSNYLASTTVVVAELYKFVLTLLLVFFKDYAGRHDRSGAILDLLRTSGVAAFPAFLYALQNNLVFIALSNLDAATFQVMYQTKIITTALFSVTLLGRRLSITQTISLLLLFIGVVLVQTPSCPDPANSFANSIDSQHRNVFLGFMVICAISCTSGFAGVYFEKIMKSGSGTPFTRNLQLAFWGFIFSVITMYANDRKALSENGFFHGYNWVVWAIINISALGGILIALVVSYTDNIAKGFATSISIILSSIISARFFGFDITLIFVMGASVVILSVVLYSEPDKAQQAKKLSATKV